MYEAVSKAQSTVDVCNEYLTYWIHPRWKDVRVTAVKHTEVEAWLHSLSLADGTKAKIRNIMSAVFQHGLRRQIIAANPIRGLVRQSAKRRRDPEILTAEEISSIVRRLSSFDRTLVFLAAATGLRFSELRGLQWQDVDFDGGVLNLRRGVVKKRETIFKSRASRKPAPLDLVLVEALRIHRNTSAYNQPSDWIFASVRAKGKVPVWPSSLLEKHIPPAVKATTIKKQISWHVCRRHSYASLLKGNAENIKVVQEAIRHANFQITANIDVQAIPQAVRTAHSRVVKHLAASTAEANPDPLGPDWTGIRRACL